MPRGRPKKSGGRISKKSKKKNASKRRGSGKKTVNLIDEIKSMTPTQTNSLMAQWDSLSWPSSPSTTTKTKTMGMNPSQAVPPFVSHGEALRVMRAVRRFNDAKIFLNIGESFPNDSSKQTYLQILGSSNLKPIWLDDIWSKLTDNPCQYTSFKKMNDDIKRLWDNENLFWNKMRQSQQNSAVHCRRHRKMNAIRNYYQMMASPQLKGMLSTDEPSSSERMVFVSPEGPKKSEIKVDLDLSIENEDLKLPEKGEPSQEIKKMAKTKADTPYPFKGSQPKTNPSMNEDIEDRKDPMQMDDDDDGPPSPPPPTPLTGVKRSLQAMLSSDLTSNEPDNHGESTVSDDSGEPPAKKVKKICQYLFETKLVMKEDGRQVILRRKASSMNEAVVNACAEYRDRVKKIVSVTRID